MKTLKATVPSGGAGLMKALVLSMFFVSLLFINSCANLIEATRKGDTAGVNALLNKGADVNAKNKYGATALMVASAKGHTEIAKALIDKGADVNAKVKYGATALMAASSNGHTDIVKALLEKGADVNAKNNDGVTALMAASEKGHTEIVQLLKTAGAEETIEKKPPVRVEMPSERKTNKRGEICCNTNDGTTRCQKGISIRVFNQTSESNNYGPCYEK